MIYADDTQIYLSFPWYMRHEGVRRITEDATGIFNFAHQNGVNLNLKKTMAIVLGSARYVNRVNEETLPPIVINDTIIPYVSEAKSLGIWLTPALNWNVQTRNISRKIHFALRSLRIHRHHLTFDIRKTLVQSLIFPLLDYACVVYYDLTGEQNLTLQRALNACVRFVFGNIARREHITSYRLKLNWLTTKSRRDYFLGTLFHSVIKTNEPQYLAEPLQALADIALRLRRSSRSNSNMRYIQNHRTTYMANSFTIAGSYLWNSLPDLVKSSGSTDIYKNRLLSFLHTQELILIAPPSKL